MFVVEIIQSIGKPPLCVEASQLVVRLQDGTPISLAALYGSKDSVLVSHCDDSTFNDNLRKLGINETVVSSELKVDQ